MIQMPTNLKAIKQTEKRLPVKKQQQLLLKPVNGQNMRWKVNGAPNTLLLLM